MSGDAGMPCDDDELAVDLAVRMKLYSVGQCCHESIAKLNSTSDVEEVSNLHCKWGYHIEPERETLYNRPNRPKKPLSQTICGEDENDKCVRVSQSCSQMYDAVPNAAE